MDLVTFEALGPVARLSLNRPKAMNAINRALLDQLELSLAEAAARDDIRVAILTAVGSAFCAGADLKEVLAAKDLAPGEPDLIDRSNDVFGALRNFPKPVIAALNGAAMAGGLELAMCADIILAAESARIGDCHANYGVFPGAGGAAVLPRLLPLNLAMYLLMTGKTLSAAEIKGYGLIAEVHPDADLAEAALSLAREIAAKSPAALSGMKEVARAANDKSRDDALRHEQLLMRKHMRSFDLAEGLSAFAERRAPVFVGR